VDPLGLYTIDAACCAVIGDKIEEYRDLLTWLVLKGEEGHNMTELALEWAKLQLQQAGVGGMGATGLASRAKCINEVTDEIDLPGAMLFARGLMFPIGGFVYSLMGILDPLQYLMPGSASPENRMGGTWAASEIWGHSRALKKFKEIQEECGKKHIPCVEVTPWQDRWTNLLPKNK
jgi:hypothetical protein